MHKDFYASGFLYHPNSQQILLQQQNSASDNPGWSLFGKKAVKDKSGEETFKQLFYEEFNIKLSKNKIKSVYYYFSKELNKDQNIYYAEVKSLHRFSKSKKNGLAWFTFKQIQKLNLSDQTKHDIIVSQRVIDSSIRKSLGQQTIG
jgi:hypothetical protein